ncbi:hypothetical protein NAP1_14403 [Erythrobacter sp. NAP1]|uniref:hypothetical protein n=1 Tax=Erythrobacter sp. NAP1 TaxID=237727 RepID=UPI000068799F|nr:hypothetical protein [Erythrobacter sp. NAP1]EAQ28798.1 hypothetical protein NAP1_14403 [Erythrobacter sp. NAP1]
MTRENSVPGTPELFFASLVATALVYFTGIAIIAVMVGLTSSAGALSNMLTFLAMFATIGVGAAVFVAFLIVAPLGTAVGLAVLRLTPPAWWQGPLAGGLVAATLVAVTLLLFQLGGQPLDWGVYAMAAVPLALAPVAGGLVQKHLLHWPGSDRQELTPA